VSLLLQRLDRKSQSLKKLLELRSIRSARVKRSYPEGNRILQYLLFSVSPGETTILFDRAYKDIASELGLSPETLYRTLAELEREKIITRQGRQIKLATYRNLMISYFAMQK
jgi:CRP-like cAMP-binding protein